AGARRAGRGPLRRRRWGAGPPARAAAWPLTVEPGIDVALSEAPLAADAHRRNLARLDETVHGSEVDLEVLEHFLGREKRLVNHCFNVLRAGATGSSTVKTAPPSG